MIYRDLSFEQLLILGRVFVPYKQRVGGSIPSTPTKILLFGGFCHICRIAPIF